MRFIFKCTILWIIFNHLLASYFNLPLERHSSLLTGSRTTIVTVKKGDSLSEILSRRGQSEAFSEALMLNPWLRQNPNLLLPNQQLILPSTSYESLTESKEAVSSKNIVFILSILITLYHKLVFRALKRRFFHQNRSRNPNPYNRNRCYDSTKNAERSESRQSAPPPRRPSQSSRNMTVERAFTILELPVSSTPSRSQLRGARRELSRKLHPDIAGEASTALMQEVNEAYAYLEKRLSL